MELDYDPVELVYTGGYGEAILQPSSHESGSKILRPPSIRATSGHLAPISTSRLDYVTLREMDEAGFLKHDGIDLLRVLEDEEYFLQHCAIHYSPSVTSRRISRHMLHHYSDMQMYDVVSPGTPKLSMPMFCVPKKDPSLLRLILDCRNLNKLCAPPPSMQLPSLHEMIDYLMQNQYACQCDAKSWFYQFGLDSSLKSYFGARLGGHRGLALSEVVMNCMPMGW
jgi:hypothetical protein